MTAGPRRVGAVVNPAAGDGRAGALADDLAAILDAATVETAVTGGPDDVRAATRRFAGGNDARTGGADGAGGDGGGNRDGSDDGPRDGPAGGDGAVDLLAVVGGDGTLGEAADALAGLADPPPTVAVPAGRGNSAYRHLYGEADWRDVARGLGAGVEAVPADLGRVRAADVDRRFVLGVSAGLFRRALGTARRLSALPGPVAYLLGTARAVVADDPFAVTVEADGERAFEGTARLVAVGGGRYRGRSFELLPGSRRADGDLHLVAVEPAGVRGTVAVTRLAGEGRHVEHPAVHYRRAASFAVSTPAGLPVEVDGTPLPGRPGRLDLEVEPGAFRVAVPADECGGR